jgi:DNA-binding CsgD family transcriptional regulator
MNRSGFILAIDSYLVRKGMVAVLNRIPGAVVTGEFDTVLPLAAFLKNHQTGFLVISQSIFDDATDLFLSNAALLERTILVTDLHEGSSTADVHASIHPQASKEKIIGTIKEILDSRSGQTSDSQAFKLSEREKTIVRLVSLGLTNKQIADQLFLSAHTVITHRKNISSKLGIKSVSGLTIYAIVNNIITIDEAASKPDQ